MKYNPYPEAKLQEDAGKINNYFHNLKETGQTDTLVGMLEGHVVNAIISNVSGGNGIAVATNAPVLTVLDPPPTLPNVPPPLHVPDFGDPIIEYTGPEKQDCHKLVDDKVVSAGAHFILGRRDDLPRYCLEQSPGKLMGLWVKISTSRRNAMIKGSMMMSQDGYIVGNPLWRNWLAQQHVIAREPAPVVAVEPLVPVTPAEKLVALLAKL